MRYNLRLNRACQCQRRVGLNSTRHSHVCRTHTSMVQFECRMELCRSRQQPRAFYNSPELAVRHQSIVEISCLLHTHEVDYCVVPFVQLAKEPSPQQKKKDSVSS